jgi:hypothetical protein
LYYYNYHYLHLRMEVETCNTSFRPSASLLSRSSQFRATTSLQ